MKRLMTILFLISGLSLQASESQNNNLELCLSTLNEQTQVLREARQAMNEALEKENRHHFDNAVIDLDYAFEVLSEGLTVEQKARQNSLLKNCNDAHQIKALLHEESMVSLLRQARCHREVNIANAHYQGYQKSKSGEDLARYKKAIKEGISGNACSKNVKIRLEASLKRVNKI